MANSSNHYKYPPSTDPTAGPHRINTQKLCDEHGVKWLHKFRQRDVTNFFQQSFGPVALAAGGNCQVLNTMYIHFRDKFVGQPEIGRRLFKYWCFMNAEKLMNRGQKSNEGEMWKKWYEENKLSIDSYFKKRGCELKDLLSVVDDFWDNINLRQKAADAIDGYPKYESLKIMEINEEKNNFKISFVRPSIDVTIDLDFMHKHNPDLFLDNSKDFKGNIDDLAEAMAHEIFDRDKPLDEFRILAKVKGNGKFEEPHSISFSCLKDDPHHIEFVDANRGVFLIPSNDREKFKKFFKGYFEQPAYKLLYEKGISSLVVENYVKPSPEQKANLTFQKQETQINQRAERLGKLRGQSNSDEKSANKSGG